MPARIDHVITAAADLTQFETVFTRLGFHVVGGGQHPHLGTRNRIILLDQGYIELLAIADEQTASPELRDRIATSPGWIGFALQSADIAAEADEMRARGADVRGPRPGRLVASNGRMRSWQSVTVGGDDLFSAAEPIPFLIQHDSSGEQHQQELAGADAIKPHPNGALRLDTVVIAVASLVDAVRSFAQAFALAPLNEATNSPELGATAGVLPLLDADERIVLAQPNGAGIIYDRLSTAGEGVCCVSVVVADLAATRRFVQRSSVPYEPWENGLLIPAEVAGGAPLAFVEDVIGVT